MGIRMTPEEQQRFLETRHTAIITTIRKDGRPSSTPTWFVVLDGLVYIGTPPGAAKLGHLRRDSRCCLLVESGEAWTELAAIQIQANAVILESGDEAKAVEGAMDEKYDAFRTPQAQMPDSAQHKYVQSVYVRLEPDGDPVTWDNNKLRLKG